ncbi:complement component C1q receptor [Corythoichthys intestinalis]|uniref:complement component C1q receptor n=1 Tax=Corythoichthys intestinalis TaxID=161448 RepID=UPI0025A4F637|nr:complement component C1q receptor [Corythoichthys intestinalis]
MACLNFQILLAWYFFMFSVNTCICTGHAGACSPFCIGSSCLFVNRDKVDFTTAEEQCHARKGKLLAFQSAGDKRLFEMVRQELTGNFWLGLHLPTNACSNLSLHMRGYEWSSAEGDGNFVPSDIVWENDVRICSPSCVSISNEKKLKEWPCSYKIDGFLCRTSHKEACHAQGLSDETFFRSSKGCSGAPCEHQCTPVKDGFKCSCFQGFAPDVTDPKRCQIHCAQERCPAVCERNTDSACFCPKGFIINEKFCEDINECSMNECDQDCKNTFGSFVCACKDGYVLKHQVKCIKVVDDHLVITTPSVRSYAKPDNDTMKGSSLSAGTFIWLWILAVSVVIVFICVGRFYMIRRQKRREQNSNQRSSVPVEIT